MSYDDMTQEQLVEHYIHLNKELTKIKKLIDGVCPHGHVLKNNKTKQGQCRTCNRIAGKAWREKNKGNLQHNKLTKGHVASRLGIPVTSMPDELYEVKKLTILLTREMEKTHGRKFNYHYGTYTRALSQIAREGGCG